MNKSILNVLGGKYMKQVKSLGLLIIGNLLQAFAIAIILNLNISVGGVSGLAKVLTCMIPISLTYVLYGIYIILFLLALFLLGKETAMKMVISCLIFPIFLECFVKIEYINVLQSDLLLASIISGTLLGIGAGLVLISNGSGGSFDVIAMIMDKYFNVPIAIVNGLCDACVLLLQIDTSHLLNSIYGILVILATNIMINKMITKGNNEVKMMIFSKKALELKELLLNNEDCGLTLLKAESGYQSNTMHVIVSVMPYNKVQACKQEILLHDPEAFIVLENVQAAYTGKYRLRKPEDYKIA